MANGPARRPSRTGGSSPASASPGALAPLWRQAPRSRLVRTILVALCWAGVVIAVQRQPVPWEKVLEPLEGLASSVAMPAMSAKDWGIIASPSSVEEGGMSASRTDDVSADNLQSNNMASVKVLLTLEASALEAYLDDPAHKDWIRASLDDAGLLPKVSELGIDVARVMRRPDYVITNETMDSNLRTRGRDVLDEVASLVFQSAGASSHGNIASNDLRPVVLDAPSLILLVPFLLEALEKRVGSASNVQVLIAADEGMNTAFRAALTHALEHVFPFFVDEDRIDNVCLERKQQSTAWARPTCEFKNWMVTRISLPAGHDCLPCTIVETRVLQRASLWAALIPSLARLPENVRIVKARVLEPRLRDEDGQAPPGRKPLIGNVDFGMSALFAQTDSPVTRPLWQRSLIVHKRLAEEVAEILFLAQKSVGFSEPILDKVALCPGMERFIDAGSCWPKERGVSAKDRGPSNRMKQVNVAVVSCLPQLIIAGVQKAGTAEMGIWLDENTNFRRQDGGMETHYFDCTGRGAGKDRPSCRHFRDKRMKEIGQAVKDDRRVGTVRNIFAWNETAHESRSWYLYATLGHLNFAQMLERRLVFDKSPAYFDLAHPMDVMRVMPHVKIVFILRNPVDRFHSSYFQMCVRNLASVNSRCSEAKLSHKLERMLSRRQDPIQSAQSEAGILGEHDVEDVELYRALRVGHYAEHLARWQRAFSDHQILVLFAETFRSAPDATLRAVEEFASRPIGALQPMDEAVKDLEPFKYSPVRASNGYWVVNNRSKAFHPSHKSLMRRETRAMLEAYYSPWNRRLTSLLRR
ncbi:Bifunctional heparan sulfate N-deacetylase/N-sulfotransferase 1 [Hondaea fermentalgiana]|uniref:Bifunctional heparan sulfate N-deacetylase/N-sulfotransferase 1 n=1 Tax=Hondaea fermentalgiana TaxID=2315210 RepID=A0A2R5GDX6_9STRA|nr:Bifunctional heparan sulfate N-deacetylase/N-sulfotransferase 1 [Hondaea fermentalgiana]|eukprot:GBG27928.1 Bifunctional heparan sulfate N-deacetylase/N-sulfotransferase 1 [Hondaea fermentalgiana]